MAEKDHIESEENKLYFGVINLTYKNGKKRGEALPDRHTAKELFTEILNFSSHKQAISSTDEKEANFMNLSKENLQALLQGVVEKLKGNQNYRHVAGFFSCHGCEKLLCRSKDNYVMEHFIECIKNKESEDESQHFPTFAMLDMFNTAELNHITKIFLIQACRGSKLSSYEDTQDYGVSITVTDCDSDNESGSSSQNQEERTHTEREAHTESKVEELRKRIRRAHGIKEKDTGTLTDKDPEYKIDEITGLGAVTFDLEVGYVGKKDKKSSAEDNAAILAVEDLDIAVPSPGTKNWKQILKNGCTKEPVYRSYGIGDTATCIVTVLKKFKFSGLSSENEEKAKESAAGVALSHMTFGGIPPCIPNAVVAFASPSGKEAFSGYDVTVPEDGGWLPVALYLKAQTMIKERKTETDFLQLLTLGNSQMSDRSTKGLKAAGTFHHQLTEKLVFQLHNKISEDNNN